MDKPTSALADREIKELFTTIRRLKTNGVSIIYISHRLGVLRNGLDLLGVSSFVQQTVIRSVIILAVLMDMALKKHRR